MRSDLAATVLLVVAIVTPGAIGALGWAMLVALELLEERRGEALPRAVAVRRLR